MALAPTATGALATQGMRTQAVTYERLVLREGGADALAQARTMNEELLEREACVPSDDGAPDGYWTWAGVGDDGVIATLRVGRLGLALPVRAGTSDDVLSRGLGHLPGTSLPVGGTGTRCVLAGHTDYRDLELFSHIDELEPGDVVELTGVGGHLRYAVRDVRVTGPADTSALAIEPGHDLLTLLTCYPAGVNTHRLLVTCERAYEGNDPDADEQGEGTNVDSQGSDADAHVANASQDLPGWAVAALCALVAACSGGLVGIACAYPAICANVTNAPSLHKREPPG